MCVPGCLILVYSLFAFQTLLKATTLTDKMTFISRNSFVLIFTMPNILILKCTCSFDSLFEKTLSWTKKSMYRVHVCLAHNAVILTVFTICTQSEDIANNWQNTKATLMIKTIQRVSSMVFVVNSAVYGYMRNKNSETARHRVSQNPRHQVAPDHDVFINDAAPVDITAQIV